MWFITVPKMATLKVFVLLFAAIFAVEAQQQGTVVLYNNGTSSSNSAGIVRVYYNGQWGNICNDYYDDFGYDEANVVCHQLGYTGAYDYSTAGSENYGTDTSPTLLTDVDCFSSSYLVLLSCDYSSYSSGCTDDDDITVDCYSTRIWDSSPFSGMVRLQGGTYSNNGRVEVYCNGQWGTVCDDIGYTYNTGDTVCKQLGYSGAYSLTSDAGNDYSLPTWLDDVDCSSYDSCLSNCRSCPSSSKICFDDDAGVTCKYSGSGNDYNTQNTCLSADSSLPIGAIVGIIIGSIFLFLFCVCLAIMTPVCICCCLGIGIGAAAGAAGRYDTV